jgi:hypothetical protein
MEVWNRLSNCSPSSPSRSVTNDNFHLLFKQCRAKQRRANARPSVNKYSANAADAPVALPARRERRKWHLMYNLRRGAISSAQYKNRRRSEPSVARLRHSLICAIVLLRVSLDRSLAYAGRYQEPSALPW